MDDKIKYIDISHSRQKNKYYSDDEKVNINVYTPEWETKVAISKILDISFKQIEFRHQLREMLSVLMSISWLKIANQSAIFVVNNQNQLILKAEHNLHKSLKKICAKVQLGQCLCGIAAEKKEIIYKSCVDDDHYNGMKEHGHYNIPLLDNDKILLGVLVLYLDHHHIQHPEEMTLMEMVGQTFSNVIANRTLQYQTNISQILQQKAQIDIIHKLVSAAEYRDNETGEHIKRMSNYAAIIARKIGMNDKDVETLLLAAPLHDIGKVGIPDSILLKPGKLTADEFTVMRTHAQIGADILSGAHKLIKAGREIACSHHEKWDGTGYPSKLAGNNIPLMGRVCALADVFDALTSKRPYKDEWSIDKALSYISEQSGKHFDPEIVTAFLSSMDDILKIKSIYSEQHHELIDKKPTVIKQQASSLDVYWDSSCTLNIDLLDEPQKYFFNLIKLIHTAIESNQVLDTINHLIELREYAEMYFLDEEKSMLDDGYPSLAQHKKLHLAFIKKLELFLTDYEIAPLAIIVELTAFLTDWLVKHIQKSDADYTQFLKNK